MALYFQPIDRESLDYVARYLRVRQHHRSGNFHATQRKKYAYLGPGFTTEEELYRSVWEEHGCSSAWIGMYGLRGRK